MTPPPPAAAAIAGVCAASKKTTCPWIHTSGTTVTHKLPGSAGISSERRSWKEANIAALETRQDLAGIYSRDLGLAGCTNRRNLAPLYLMPCGAGPALPLRRPQRVQKGGRWEHTKRAQRARTWRVLSSFGKQFWGKCWLFAGR
eukprot:gene12707-biopygen3459